MPTFHINHTLVDITDSLVTVCAWSFIEDVVAIGVCPSLGLFRDRTTYAGQAQGAFHNHIVTNTDDGLVALDCLCAIDDSVADIGVVTSDIYGNELAIQKRTAGAH